MEINNNCICPRKSCSRHGNCEACRKHHAEKRRNQPPYCEKDKQKEERSRKRDRRNLES